MSPMPGTFCIVCVMLLFMQTRNRERLTVAQLELGLGPARRERRECGSPQHDGVVEVEHADLGPHLEVHAVAVHGRREVQADAELLELDRHADVGAGALGHRNRELAAGQEARFLAAFGHEIRLGEALEEASVLQRRTSSPRS